MTIQELVAISEKKLPFPLTPNQFILLNSLAAFVLHHGPRDVFILNGYAGTGKTSVIGALVKGMEEAKIKNIILSPTGRAAKVASHLADKQAFTIHKRLFRGNGLDPSQKKNYFLSDNKDQDTLFIIDEASLIPDSPHTPLLQLLINHIYSSPGCAMILVGDIAQLPPIGMAESPAMSKKRLSELLLNPINFDLTEPLRQAAKSGILYNAIFIRKSLFSDRPFKKFGILKKNFPDISCITTEFLEDYLTDSWKEVGSDQTIIITRSNKRANEYNQAIRTLIMYAETPLEKGDRIIIAKNDYFWSKHNKTKGFLANGESAEVLWRGNVEKKYGKRFIDVELSTADQDETIEAKIILNSLYAEGPSISNEEMQSFFNRIMTEYEGEVSTKIKKTLTDPYYNALQIKYAYSVTCHKAQGGQWKHVYIDLSGLKIEDGMEKDFYRWLYTAATRATEHLYFINSPLKVK